MGKLNELLNIGFYGWRARLRDASLGARVSIGCVTLLLMFCCCAVPLMVISTVDETAVTPTPQTYYDEEVGSKPIELPTIEPTFTP